MDILLLMLFVLFVFSSTVLLFYTWYFFSRLAFYKRGNGYRKDLPPVSVIIAARNEYENLKTNLPHILKQDYPEYEVIVVNDVSDDETGELLDEFKIKYSHLRKVNLTQSLNFFRGKKFPLSLGIKAARHDVLLMTDADCRPAGKHWIRKMAGNYAGDTQVVLGYGAYERKKGWLDKLVRFETIHVAMQYFSFALAGMPYMGVGRNLSYLRSLFYRSGGFISHYKVTSGDDDLFVHKVAHKGNTSVEVDPESHTVSSQPASFGALLKQKRRHLSTGAFYSLKFRFILGLYSLMQFLFWISFIILMIFGYNILYLLLIWVGRSGSQMVIFNSTTQKLKEADLLFFSPLLEFIFVLINPLLVLANLFFKQDKWK